MLKKINAFMARMGLSYKPDIPLSPICNQECTRDAATKKRVRNYIESQHELLVVRAMRPHGPDCADPIDCNNMDCFKFVPDVIIDKPYKVDYKTRRRI